MSFRRGELNAPVVQLADRILAFVYGGSVHLSGICCLAFEAEAVDSCMHAALLHRAIHRLHQQIPLVCAAEEEDFSTWTEAFHLATLSDRCVTGMRQRGASGNHLLHGLSEGLQPCAGKPTGGVPNARVCLRPVTLEVSSMGWPCNSQ